MRVSWDESGDGRGRSRAKKETNKEGKSCAAPRRCCPRSQISLRTYYGYFSCGPLLQSLPRNRNRARLFGIMFRWRQEFQEVLIPDIRGCRASSSFHIILVMVGELTLTAQTFAGKSFPNSDTPSHEEVWYFPFTPPPPTSALSSVSCRLCSYVHAITLQRNINWGCSVKSGRSVEPLIGLPPPQWPMGTARANLVSLRLDTPCTWSCSDPAHCRASTECFYTVVIPNDLNGPPVFAETVTWLALAAEASKALKWTNVSSTMLERTFLVRVLMQVRDMVAAAATMVSPNEEVVLHIVPNGLIGQKVVTVKTDRFHISFGCWRSKIYSF